MKQISIMALCLIVVSTLSFAEVNCVELTGCAKKECEVNKQIEIATKMDNAHKIKGLTEALGEIRDHCTDDKLISDIEKDIKEVNKDLVEHKADLEEAKIEQKNDKIEKYTQKIAEDTKELKQLNIQLSQMKK